MGSSMFVWVLLACSLQLTGCTSRASTCNNLGSCGTGNYRLCSAGNDCWVDNGGSVRFYCAACGDCRAAVAEGAAWCGGASITPGGVDGDMASPGATDMSRDLALPASDLAQPVSVPAITATGDGINGYGTAHISGFTCGTDQVAGAYVSTPLPNHFQAGSPLAGATLTLVILNYKIYVEDAGGHLAPYLSAAGTFTANQKSGSIPVVTLKGDATYGTLTMSGDWTCP